MKKTFSLIRLFAAFFSLYFTISPPILASEQSGSSPTSSSDSRIKTLSTALTVLSHGSTASGAWGNWGAFWNQIYSSSIWVPNGNALIGDVLSGKTFFTTDRNSLTGTMVTQTLSSGSTSIPAGYYAASSLYTVDNDLVSSNIKSGITIFGVAGNSNVVDSSTGDATAGQILTGKKAWVDGVEITGSYTASSSVDYSLQSLATIDDNTGSYKGEEATWTEVAGSPFANFAAVGLDEGRVKSDSVTGLWWSAPSASVLSNAFTLSGDGSRPTGGDSIGLCDTLNTNSYAGRTNWYLPTQKELLQAYIDGIYSQDTTFGTNNYFWSSTQESTNSLAAQFVNLMNAYAGNNGKTFGAAYKARCVSR